MYVIARTMRKKKKKKAELQNIMLLNFQTYVWFTFR